MWYCFGYIFLWYHLTEESEGSVQTPGIEYLIARFGYQYFNFLQYVFHISFFSYLMHNLLTLSPYIIFLHNLHTLFYKITGSLLERFCESWKIQSMFYVYYTSLSLTTMDISLLNITLTGLWFDQCFNLIILWPKYTFQWSLSWTKAGWWILGLRTCLSYFHCLL